MPIAALDACILFQGRLTNLLLHLAAAGAFEPIWSDAIHAEAEKTWVAALRPPRREGKASAPHVKSRPYSPKTT